MQLIKRLQQVLETWEANCFLMWILERFSLEHGTFTEYPLIGATANWQDFRAYLKSITPLEKNFLYDTERFPLVYLGNENNYPFSHIPCALSHWVWGGKRVYEISADATMVFFATKLDKLRWQDVQLPLPAFTITLEHPIYGPNGHEYDTIIVSTSWDERGRRVLSFLLLNKLLDQRQRWVSKDDVQNLTGLLSKRRWVKLAHKINQVARRGDMHNVPLFSFFQLFPDQIEDMLVNESVMNQYNQGARKVRAKLIDPAKTQNPEWDAALRVVIAMIQYLRTFPVPQRIRSDQGPLKDRISKNKPVWVPESDDVCVVASTIRLREEARVYFREYIRNPTAEASTRIVEGYNRRPPNTAHIVPPVPRSEWVSPYIRGMNTFLETGEFEGAVKIID